MKHFEKVFQCFPQEIQRQIGAMDQTAREAIEEVRVYRDREVRLMCRGRAVALRGRVSGSDITNILNNLLKFSYYAYEEDLAKGFVTIDGGHRVGICGKAVMEKGKVTLLREISSLNIRCCHEIIGCSRPLKHLLVKDDGRTSQPAHRFSAGLREDHHAAGYRPKSGRGGRAQSSRLRRALRDRGHARRVQQLPAGTHDRRAGRLSQSRRDSHADPRHVSRRGHHRRDRQGGKTGEAIKTCRNCGVSVIASAHGSDIEDIRKLPISGIIDSGTFDHIIFLSNRPSVGTRFRW